MPYIIVKAGGNVGYNVGNGTIWVDGFPHSHIKDGTVITVTEGVHSIKYVPTLKASEWTTSAHFTENTVMNAFVVDEDFSKPSFTTHIASESELMEIRSKIDSQNMQESFHKSESRRQTGWYIPRCIIGIALVVAGLYITFKFKQADWKECILPSALITVGAALIKSYPIDGQVYSEEVIKGIFMGLGWFVIMVVFNFLGDILGKLFG